MATSGVMDPKPVKSSDTTSENQKKSRFRHIRNGAFYSVVVSLVFLGGVYMGRERITPFINTRSEYMVGIYAGNSPLDLKPVPGINPVMSSDMVTDVKASFTADPFLYKKDGIWYLFFEIMKSDDDKGVIAVARSSNGRKFEYDRVVLEEPFHLSYPYVFEYENEYYMIPESQMDYSISLYKTDNFPYGWKKEQTLIEGNFLDPSLVHYKNDWYLFAADRNDVLHLFWAEDLKGPWKTHEASPIIKTDLENARPGGRMIVMGDTVIRYAQNCKPQYGWEINAFLITDLSPNSYSEIPFAGNPLLKGSGVYSDWNGIRMHQIDPHQLEDGTWIAAVDGVGKWREFGFGFFGNRRAVSLGPKVVVKNPYASFSTTQVHTRE